ncbi:hypothetical protein EDD21DRAFT_387306 [Dissophora ornata]|nr:hypothetical protein EDD21DRAFT_387306 [Dissophora ornata]
MIAPTSQQIPDNKDDNQSVLQLPKDSTEFIAFNEVFQQHLNGLYVIRYSDELSTPLKHGEWQEYYYYPAGHCTCLGPEPGHPDGHDFGGQVIESVFWCDKRRCPVRPIVNLGYQSGYSNPRGMAHLVITKTGIAGCLNAESRVPSGKLLAIFVCKARDVYDIDSDTSVVHNNSNLIPVYMAVVRA